MGNSIRGTIIEIPAPAGGEIRRIFTLLSQAVIYIASEEDENDEESQGSLSWVNSELEIYRPEQGPAVVIDRDGGSVIYGSKAAVELAGIPKVGDAYQKFLWGMQDTIWEYSEASVLWDMGRFMSLGGAYGDQSAIWISEESRYSDDYAHDFSVVMQFIADVQGIVYAEQSDDSARWTRYATAACTGDLVAAPGRHLMPAGDWGIPTGATMALPVGDHSLLLMQTTVGLVGVVLDADVKVLRSLCREGSVDSMPKLSRATGRVQEAAVPGDLPYLQSPLRRVCWMMDDHVVSPPVQLSAFLIPGTGPGGFTTQKDRIRIHQFLCSTVMHYYVPRIPLNPDGTPAGVYESAFLATGPPFGLLAQTVHRALRSTWRNILYIGGPPGEWQESIAGQVLVAITRSIEGDERPRRDGATPAAPEKDASS